MALIPTRSPQVFVYSLKRGTFDSRAIPSMPHTRSKAAGCLLPTGDLMVCGGEDERGAPRLNTWIYSFSTEKWERGDSLKRIAKYHRLIPISRNHIRLGHRKKNQYYDVTNKRWTRGDVSDKITDNLLRVPIDADYHLVINKSSQYIQTPTTRRFKAVSAMPFRRKNAAGCALADGRVLITGGRDPEWRKRSCRKAQIYDPILDTWTDCANMNFVRENHTLIPFENKVYAFGTLARDEVYDVLTDTWTDIKPYCVRSSGHWSAAIFYYGTDRYSETLERKMLRIINKEQQSQSTDSSLKRQRTQ